MGVRVTDSSGLASVGSTEFIVSDDGDSTPQAIDNCPGIYNYSQADTDGDDDDVEEAAPGEPAPAQPVSARVIPSFDSLLFGPPDDSPHENEDEEGGAAR